VAADRRHVVCVATDVSEYCRAFKRLLGLFDVADEVITVLRNARNCPPSDIAPHPTTLA
jgi:hypothetical protein